MSAPVYELATGAINGSNTEVMSGELALIQIDGAFSSIEMAALCEIIPLAGSIESVGTIDAEVEC